MLDAQSQLALLGALDELRQGSSRRFEDRLWLGFGDQWQRVRTLLLRDEAIREVGGDVPGYRLEPRGEALLVRLSEARAPKSAAAITAINVAITEGTDG